MSHYFLWNPKSKLNDSWVVFCPNQFFKIFWICSSSNVNNSCTDMFKRSTNLTAWHQQTCRQGKMKKKQQQWDSKNWMANMICPWASCATCGRDPCTLLHERLSADPAWSRTMQRHWDDLKSIAQQELTLLIFHTVRSLIRLVFIASHLVCYSTITSLDL